MTKILWLVAIVLAVVFAFTAIYLLTPDPYAPTPQPSHATASLCPAGTITGIGDDVVDVTKYSSCKKATIINDSPAKNFIVWPYDATGNQKHLLVNHLDKNAGYEGTVMWSDDYATLEINATGPWSITFK